MPSLLSSFFAICLLALVANIGFAQNFYKERVPRPHSVHLSLGPASMYTDNGGPYRNFEFPISPAVNLGLAKKLTNRINMRATLGFQHVTSNKSYNPNLALAWGREGNAYAFQGNAYTLDLMPEFYYSPFNSHIERPKYNGYAGIGLGFIVLPREQAVATPDGQVISNETGSSLYVPIRFGGMIGVSPLWDIGFEASIIAILSDDIDGNAEFNSANDMLLQGQFFVKRYLSPFPLWKKWFK